MTYEAFLDIDPDRATGLSPALTALALDRAGRWDAAHDLVAQEETVENNLVHAYLHRKEGSVQNARYWYDRVGEAVPDVSAEAEWSALVRRFLG